jgi:hypothetical protein
MSDDGLHALEAELRASAPKGLRGLTEADLRDLAGAVAAARHRQAAELQAAGDQALRHIPRLLRGPIRKVLG